MTQRFSPTNRSGTITTGGQAQQFASENSIRNGYTIQNPLSNNASLWLNDTGADAQMNTQSLEIPAGGTLTVKMGAVSTKKLSIIGATTGMAFFGREW